MKKKRFHFTMLVSLLSGITFFSAPAVSMTDDTSSPSTVKRKPALPKTERDILKNSLGFFNAVDIYASLRPVNGASNEDLIQYIITQSPGHKEAWSKLTPPQKEWFFSSVENRALKNAVARPDLTLITYSAIRKGGNIASAEDLISYLMGKETAWKALQPPQKQWFIAKATLADHLATTKTTNPAAAIPLVQDLLDLSQDRPTEAIKSAAASGQLETFNYLLQQARIHGTFSQELLNESLKSAVVGYWLDLSDDEGKLLQIRNVINELLDMHDNGPTQKGVDFAFRIAVSSSANQFSGDLRLLQIMLFDRTTRQLRTGLRPTNETIKDLRDTNYFTDKKITEFLKSLNL